MKDSHFRLKNRELSWLAFNGRVLQEAAHSAVPLYERIKFLAIFSSNIDEFFRVRVASLRALLNLKKKTKKKLDFDPAKLLKRIHRVVDRQQEEFGEIFRQIRRELKKRQIFLMKETDLTAGQASVVRGMFEEHVRQHIRPVFLDSQNDAPFLENRAISLTVKLVARALHPGEPGKKNRSRYALVPIPTAAVPRFLALPPDNGRTIIMFLDDVIRLCLPDLFPEYEIMGAYAIKLTRDAELYIDDEFTGDLLEKIKKALRRRDRGVPSRFLYDADIPAKHLAHLKELFTLSDDDMVRGGRYHNFHDFFTFPAPPDPDLRYEPMPPVTPQDIPPTGSLFEEIARRDILLYYPYHSYEPVLRFLAGAADDPEVVSIHITLYRVARDSRVVRELLRACERGKSVTAFFEIKARFDEESNIRRAEELERAGARVFYSIPGMKVHAKLCLVTRTTRDGPARLAYLSTGNFNEKAAELYTDFGLLTARDAMTDEVARVFEILCRSAEKQQFGHLLVAPFTMRKEFMALIRQEMENARNGREALIIAKMNSLEDPGMIRELYRASAAGVTVRLIVRGICCLIPGVKGMSEHIEVVSIVDRFLEHARVYWFHHGGTPCCYLSSADWMKRNLNRRIEVAFPVVDSGLCNVIRRTLDLQWNDTAKARQIDRSQSNTIKQPSADGVLQSQYAIYDMFNGGRGEPAGIV
jgi:polyphosphate kinase